MISINTEDSLNFNNYNFLISDWSGIFIEYAFIKNRKCFLILSKLEKFELIPFESLIKILSIFYQSRF